MGSGERSEAELRGREEPGRDEGRSSERWKGSSRGGNLSRIESTGYVPSLAIEFCADTSRPVSTPIIDMSILEVNGRT